MMALFLQDDQTKDERIVAYWTRALGGLGYIGTLQLVSDTGNDWLPTMRRTEQLVRVSST